MLGFVCATRDQAQQESMLSKREEINGLKTGLDNVRNSAKVLHAESEETEMAGKNFMNLFDAPLAHRCGGPARMQARPTPV